MILRIDGQEARNSVVATVLFGKAGTSIDLVVRRPVSPTATEVTRDVMSARIASPPSFTDVRLCKFGPEICSPACGLDSRVAPNPQAQLAVLKKAFAVVGGADGDYGLISPGQVAAVVSHFDSGATAQQINHMCLRHSERNDLHLDFSGFVDLVHELRTSLGPSQTLFAALDERNIGACSFHPMPPCPFLPLGCPSPCRLSRLRTGRLRREAGRRGNHPQARCRSRRLEPIGWRYCRDACVAATR